MPINKKNFNLKILIEKIDKIEIKILFFLVSFYYYLIPLFILLIDQQTNFFVPQSQSIKYDQIVLSQNFMILIFFNYLLFLSVFVFVGKNIYSFPINDKKIKKELILFNLIISLIVILISLILIYDIIDLTLFIFEYIEKNNTLINSENFNNFFKFYRDEVKSLIFQRRTHYKILIILSVYLYRYNKKLSVISYSLIILVNLIALSRFEIIQLIILHFLFNIKFHNLNFKFLSIFLVSFFVLIFYRYVLFLFGDQEAYYLQNFLGDGISTFAKNFIFYENGKDISILISSDSLYNSDKIYLIIIYFKNTFLYFLNDFFYQRNEIIDFFSHSKFSNYTFSSPPSLELILYFPLFLFYLAIFFFIKKYSFLDNYKIYNIILLTLLLFSFRGSWIHEFGFLIKFIIVIKCLEIVSKNKFILKYAKKNI